MSKPIHLFRPLSAKEVEKLWTKLFDEAVDAQNRMERCYTDDKQGIRILHRAECERQQARAEWLNHARHILVDIIAKEK
jgi:hypothetical protein